MRIFKDFAASLIILCIYFIIKMTDLAIFLHEKSDYIIVFFIAIDYLIRTITHKGFENKGKDFIQYYMASLVLKMVLMLVFIGFMILRFPGNREILILNIFVLYLYYTFFEISEILRKLRRF